MNLYSRIYSAYKARRWMRILFQLAILLLAYSAIRYWQSLDNIQGDAPIINAQTLQGNHVDLRNYQTKPVLVHFWATWCPICEFENSNIASISQDYQVITIASWSEGESQVKAYLQKEGLDMPVIVDEDGEWAKLYGVKAVPNSFVVNSDGVIQFIEKGYTSETGLRLRLWWAGKS